MIRLIEALNYKSLKYIRQEMRDFEILVGPNASGKTTFLDVPAFLGQLVRDGIDEAVDARGSDFRDLTWGGAGSSFELAIELEIPEGLRQKATQNEFDRVRYQIALRWDHDASTAVISSEGVLLAATGAGDRVEQARDAFPSAQSPPMTIIVPKEGKPGSETTYREVLTKGGIRRRLHRATPEDADGVKHVRFGPILPLDAYHPEAGLGDLTLFNLGDRKSTLANLPEDEEAFPVATWLKGVLKDGIRPVSLNPDALRKPGRRGPGVHLLRDGANLPWLVHLLESTYQGLFREWIEHLQTGVPEIASVRTVARPEDRTQFLMVRFNNGMELPSWMLSDGTLRLMALTIPAYLPGDNVVYLIEEPENGIHPKGIETVFYSLSSVYSGQVLLATHSPVILSVADPEKVLCFARTNDGATDIVRGSDHPRLVNWHGETNLGTLFAGGILG